MLSAISPRSSVVRGVKDLSGQSDTAARHSASGQVDRIARPAEVESASSLRPMIVAAM